jgi:DNA-binding phage protein
LPAREQLYRPLSAAGNPNLKTIIAAVSALGMALTTTSVDGPKLWAVA